MITTHNVTYTREEDVTESLEIKIESAFSEATANFDDLQSMLTLALSGISAKTYSTANNLVTLGANGDATVRLPLFVFVNKPGFIPVVQSNIGEATFVEESFLAREFNKIFELDTELPLGYRVTDFTPKWVSDVVTSLGNVIAPPPLTVSGTKLLSPYTIFGVLRINATLPVYIYEVVFTVTKESRYSLEDVSLSVTASVGNVNTETSTDSNSAATATDIEIPDSVIAALDPCDNTKELAGGTTVAQSSSDDPDKKQKVQIAYDTCNGKVLGTRKIYVKDTE